MNQEKIFRSVDHTVLKQTADWSAVQKLCDEAMAGGAAPCVIRPVMLPA